MTSRQLNTLELIVRHVMTYRCAIANGVSMEHMGNGDFFIHEIEFRKGAA